MYTVRPNAQVLPRTRLFTAMLVAAVGVSIIGLPGRSHAACAAPAADYGSATISLNISSTATYRLWTRMYVPDTTYNTYALQIDGGNCYIVGGAGVPSKVWTWVDYQNGSSISKVETALSQGTHTVKLIGLVPGVKVDRLVATSDLACVPTGTAGDCEAPTDLAAPTVSITAPAAGAGLSGSVTYSATATDTVGVSKVEFYANSILLNTDTTAPYSYSWDTTLAANGSYDLKAKAYDAAGNVTTSDPRSVTVSNGDASAPSIPTGVSAKATSYNKVDVSWQASTDNVAITGYVLIRDGASLVRLGATATSYTDTNVAANTTYSYQVKALDAAGNSSPASAVASVKTPTAPTETTAPSVPKRLEAVVMSSSQVNLSWRASSDNVGVTGYEVWRQTGVSPSQKVASVTGTTFGDTTLKAYTKYVYYVKAYDAAGNVSGSSQYATVTTRSESEQSELLGTISDAATGKGIPYAKLSFVVDGATRTYTADSLGKYDIDGLSGGTYYITYTASGYQPYTLQRIITANARVAQNAALQKL